jgi:hypothetical protein
MPLFAAAWNLRRIHGKEARRRTVAVANPGRELLDGFRRTTTGETQGRTGLESRRPIPRVRLLLTICRSSTIRTLYYKHPGAVTCSIKDYDFPDRDIEAHSCLRSPQLARGDASKMETRMVMLQDQTWPAAAPRSRGM